MVKPMTLSEAQRILKPPLIFGNDEQIKAVRFMEQVEAALEAYEKCDENHKEYRIYQPSKFQYSCPCIDSFDIEVRRGAYVFWKNK
jgi:hypothetical protein